MKRIPLTAKRAVQNSISDSGEVIIGTPIDVTFTASVQPADRTQLESYPFLRDFKQLYTLYSSTELKTAKAGVSECDRVTIYGVDFDVMTCEKWQNGIRSHYKMIVGR